MLKKITNNWVWKVLSLILAFVLWLAVVNYDDPYITKTFKNIPVEKQNSEAITSQELAITYIEGETINVLLGGKRKSIDNLKAADIIAYVDMKKYSITGAIDIEVKVADNIDVIEQTPKNMQIALEQIDTELKDIQVFYEGELAEDYIKLNPVVIPNQIELKGPQSKLAMVSSVIVTVKIGDVTNDITVFASPKIQDADGNDVMNLTTNKDQIQINVPIQKIKTVPVRLSTKGEVSSEYRFMKMYLETDEVMLRGETADIDNVSEILVSEIDLSTLTDEMSSMSINLTNYLPEGVLLYGSEMITDLVIDIRPIVNKEFIVTSGDIRVTSLGEQMQFKFAQELNIPVVLSGIQSELDELTLDDLRPRISLKDLEPGNHEVTLELSLTNGFVLQNSIPTISVQLTETPLEEDVEETTGDDN